MINDEIRNALNEEEMKKESLQKIVYDSDVITMLQDGLYKVLDGTTSFEEIYRIIDIDDDLDTLMKIGVISESSDKKTSSSTESNDATTNEEKDEKVTQKEIDNIEAPVIIDIEEKNPEIIPINDPDDEDVKNEAAISLPNLTT